MRMSSKGWLAVMVLATLIEIGCGETYRPTIIPNPVTPPAPQNFHATFTANTNGAANPGSALEIDVSGDTKAGQANMGIGPVHLAIQPGSVSQSTRVYTANNTNDSVSVFTASSSLGTIGTPVTINLTPGSQPVFVTSTESTSMYVANAGNNTVNALSGSTNAVTATICLNSNNPQCPGVTPSADGIHPWAMAETPDGHKLYVVNRDSSNVTSINSVDRSIASVIPTGATPQWAAARNDSKRVYVLAADGTLSTIDSEYTSGTVDTVLSTQQVGAGANFFAYDGRLNRLYIPFPTGTTVAIYNVALDPPTLMNTIDLTQPITPGGNDAPCPGGCSPVSATALQDGTRAYFASFNVDPNSANCTSTQVVGQALQPCIALQVTVLDETSNTVRSVIRVPEFAQGLQGLTTIVNCADPTQVRFRFVATSSADSSKVYVSSCDAGSIETIKTSNDSFILALTEPVSILNPIRLNPGSPTPTYPPPQTPQFIVAGP